MEQAVDDTCCEAAGRGIVSARATVVAGDCFWCHILFRRGTGEQALSKLKSEITDQAWSFKSLLACMRLFFANLYVFRINHSLGQEKLLL